MIQAYPGRRHLLRACRLSFLALALLVVSARAVPARAAITTAAAWHIESFCHRGATPARRCLIRARQGIIVFQLLELPSPPSISWDGDIAILLSGASSKTRQLRFYRPPQTLSPAFAQARAYETAEQLVASYSGNRLHVDAMFGGSRELASLTLPSDIGKDSLRLHFEGRRLLVRWRDSAGRQQRQALQAPARLVRVAQPSQDPNLRPATL